MSIAPSPDFSIAVTPATIILAQSSSASFDVTVRGVNNSNSQVAVSLSGIPSSVQASPSSFTLNAGSSQKITLTASNSVALGNTTITVNASGGSVSHSAACQLQIVAGTAQFRMRYFDTAQNLPLDLNFNIQPHALYHSQTKRFFFADAFQNRILVYDAASELQLAEITVPGAWTLDQSLDHASLYVGTEVGDIYLIDPINLKVTESIPANRIGPNGYAAYAVHPLADGRLALLGNQGGIPSIDGYGSFAIWNRADDSFAQYTTQYYASFQTPGQVVCGSLTSIAYMDVTPDRTKLMLGSADSDATVCRFDPSTAQYSTVTAPGELYAGATSVFQPTDGQEFLTTAQGTVYVFNTSTMQLQDQFSLANGLSVSRCILSLDGNTLYAISRNSGAALAYSWRTHALLGWASSPTVSGYFTDLEPMAIDETGLIGGLMGHGIGFADAGALSSGAPEVFAAADVLPSLGSITGGTNVKFAGLQGGQTALNLFFGTQAGADLSSSSSGLAATSPPHEAGVVDVLLQTTRGGLVSAFAGFSYGPSIRKIVTRTSTPEGGATESIFGYGFGPAYNSKTPSDLNVLVGGQPVQITAYNSVFRYSDGGAPTPLQLIQFTLPPGTAGASADLTVSNSSGTTTIQNAISYRPPVQTFSLPDAQLFQGVYDPRRDVYYFTDQTQVRVFSRSEGWLTSIPIPRPPAASSQRLVGISLSADATKLAISDAAADVIYVLNPDMPASVRTFTLPNTLLDARTRPCGLAISDSGIVYYASFDTGGTGEQSFHKLDISTGKAIAYAGFGSLNGLNDIYTRVILSPDNRRVFYLEQGDGVYMVDTVTDAVQRTPMANGANFELALSANQGSLAGGEWLFDGDLNLRSTLARSELQVYDVLGVYGEKLSSDGNLLFEPLENSIEIADSKTGVSLNRIGLPFKLSANYDALVSNGRDNVLVAITGQNGDGVAVIDLSSIANMSPQSRTAIPNVSAQTASTQEWGAPGVSMLVSEVEATANRKDISKRRQFQPANRRYWKRLPFAPSAVAEGAPERTEQGQNSEAPRSDSAALQMNTRPATWPMTLTETDQQSVQTISFSPIPSGQFGDSVTLAASASSGLPVRFLSRTPDVCAVTGDIVSLVSSGTCSLEASQPGNASYTAARSLIQSFAVNPRSQTINFSSLPESGTYGTAGPYTLFAIASSGLRVSFSATGPASISDSTLIVKGPGTIIVTASQSGSAQYGEAVPVSQTIVISAAQKITADASQSK